MEITMTESEQHYELSINGIKHIRIFKDRCRQSAINLNRHMKVDPTIWNKFINHFFSEKK
jgi:hypothetical protein